MGSYMLLFWAPKHLLDRPRSADDARESGERWRAWRRALMEADHEVTGGGQLQNQGRCVIGTEKTVVEGAFGRDHTMGGFFIVTAASLEQATELGKGCPVLASGGTVEVRPLMPGG